MLVPPSSSDLLGCKSDPVSLTTQGTELLLAIDPTKLTKGRQFARTAQPSRDADNSLWTETPAQRQQRIADEVAGKRRRATDVSAVEEDADARKRRKYEEEVRKGVEEHTVRHTISRARERCLTQAVVQKTVRGAALLKQHERVSAAKEAEKGEKDEPPAFWDRDRDMGLGGRLMDDSTRDKFIREAKGLGDRFGSGKSGFL